MKANSSEKKPIVTVFIKSAKVGYMEGNGSSKGYISIVDEGDQIGLYVVFGLSAEHVREDLKNTGRVLKVVSLYETLSNAKKVMDDGEILF